MRVPTLRRFKQGDVSVEMLQGATGLTVDVLQRLQILDGHLLKNIDVATTNTDIPHKLNRKYRGWFQVKGQRGAESSSGSSGSATTTVHGTIWRWNETDVTEFTSVVGAGMSIAAGTFTYGGTAASSPKIPSINLTIPSSAGAAEYIWTVNDLELPEDYAISCLVESDTAVTNAYVGPVVMYQDTTHYCVWSQFPAGSSGLRFLRNNGGTIQSYSNTPNVPYAQYAPNTKYLGAIGCTMYTKFPTASVDPGMISVLGSYGGGWGSTNGVVVDGHAGLGTAWHSGWRQTTTHWKMGVGVMVYGGGSAGGTVKIGKLSAQAHPVSSTTTTTTAINTESGGLGLREETSPDDTKFLRLVAGEASTVDLWIF